MKLSSGTAAGTLTWTHDRFQIVEEVDLCLVVWYGMVIGDEGEDNLNE
jgi:hypothetical protein